MVCFLVLAAILVAGLWPFAPFPKNKVSWAADGLQFVPPSIVLSKTPLRSRTPSLNAPSSLELWFEPAKIGPGTIVGFYDFESNRQFRITQFRDGLLLRKTARDNPVQDGPVIWIRRVLTPGRRMLLSITHGPTGTSAFVDGKLVENSSEFTLRQADVTGQIVLGTSPIYNTAWPGKIYGLAVYDRSLTAPEVRNHYQNWSSYTRSATEPQALFLFNERGGKQIENKVSSEAALYIPDDFTLSHEKLLATPWEEFRPVLAYWKDNAVNVLGFVPLGFFFCLFAASKEGKSNSHTKVILFGALISLLIEVLQSFLPTRASGVTDVITNTLGTALGAYLSGLRLVSKALPSLAKWLESPEQILKRC